MTPTYQMPNNKKKSNKIKNAKRAAKRDAICDTAGNRGTMTIVRGNDGRLRMMTKMAILAGPLQNFQNVTLYNEIKYE